MISPALGNDGTYFDRGSESESFFSCSRRFRMMPVKCLVIEAIANRVSVVFGMPNS